ncbi:ABC transporter substrate-binding protein [Prochlorococcus sp. MIT 1342]|uniref:ABC transporter substrate-binding protein n=1 Tax=Prochlorococcus sp. MIT 1342 TaxID=3082532 RepID=UPI0039B5EA5E
MPLKNQKATIASLLFLCCILAIAPWVTTRTNSLEGGRSWRLSRKYQLEKDRVSEIDSALNGEVSNSNIHKLLRMKPTPLIFAQSLVLSGPARDLGINFIKGIDLYLKKVNDQGGIEGRPIMIWRLDDGYEPDNAYNKTNQFISYSQLLGLFAYIGTPTTKASLPLAKAAGIDIISPFTGASVLRGANKAYTIHHRASYADEAKRIVDYLVNDGFVRIAIGYQNDSYGKDVLNSLIEELDKTHKLSPVISVPLVRNSRDTGNAAKEIKAYNPDALIAISTYQTVASLIQNLNSQGSYPQVMTISFTGTKSLIKELPRQTSFGIGVTQVVPFPWDLRNSVVREYQSDLRDVDPDSEFDFVSLEGYLIARKLVSALRKASPVINRSSLRQALLEENDGLISGGVEVDLVFLGTDPWQP